MSLPKQLPDPCLNPPLRAEKLRAAVRIGQISAELEKAKPLNGKGAGLPASGKTKSEVLKAAGISTSVANRAEKLAAQLRRVRSRHEVGEQFNRQRVVFAATRAVAARRCQRPAVQFEVTLVRGVDSRRGAPAAFTIAGQVQRVCRARELLRATGRGAGTAVTWRGFGE